MNIYGKRKFNIASFLTHYWVAIVIVALIIITVIASISIYKNEVNPKEEEISLIEQDKIYLASEYIDTINPILTNSREMYYITKLVYESLFSYDENLGVVKNLVESYTVNTDRAGIEITLRDDVYFSDGTKVTNQDVLNTIYAIKVAGYNSVYYEDVERITQYYITKDDKLAIWFNNNYQCALDDLTFPIFKAVKGSSYAVGAYKDTKTIGSGKYKISSYVEHKDLQLVKNEYNGNPDESYKTIIFTFVPDTNLSSKLLKISDITCYFDDSDTRKSIANDMKAKTYDICSSTVDFLVLNNAYWAKTHNQTFRKAIVQALDFTEILDDAYSSDGRLSDTIYFPNFLGTSENLSYINPNTEQALNDLREAGFYDYDNDRYLENINGEEIIIDILVNQDNSDRVYAAKLIKKQLDAIGINCNINACDMDTYKYQMSLQNFDILITGYTFSENYDLRFLFTGDNPWYYYNYSLLSKVRMLDRMYDENDYKNYYLEAKEAIVDEFIYIPICYRNMSLITVNSFETTEYPIWNNYFKGIENWKWYNIAK